ncbi:MAG: hypothetical protein JXB39_07800, partial [Deltaproteobacteria bacterium]|nr:hypothetical protein [Deltaproteobacteria bacterium]
PPPEAAPPPAPTPAPRPRRAGGPAACPALGPDVPGFWYAGRASPGDAGSEIVLASGVNVRDAYPSKATGWELGGFLCSLREGARVRIAADPVLVPGGAWWVPIRGEDLLAP